MATPKRKYNRKEIPPSTGGLNHPMKMVKMIRAACRECNPMGKGPLGWQDDCPHDPYHSMQPLGPPRPVFEEQEDGSYVQTDKVEPPKYVRRPNWRQIADDVKVASGRMVRIQVERGSKFPEELGYPPLCDYYNCWEPNPKFHANRVINHEGVQTRVGDYHLEEEAQIMTLRLAGKPIYMGSTDATARAEQIAAVKI